MLVPGLEYTFEIQVECISDLGISDQLHVFVTRDQVNKCRTICIVSTIVLIKMFFYKCHDDGQSQRLIYFCTISPTF